MTDAPDSTSDPTGPTDNPVDDPIDDLIVDPITVLSRAVDAALHPLLALTSNQAAAGGADGAPGVDVDEVVATVLSELITAVGPVQPRLRELVREDPSGPLATAIGHLERAFTLFAIDHAMTPAGFDTARTELVNARAALFRLSVGAHPPSDQSDEADHPDRWRD